MNKQRRKEIQALIKDISRACFQDDVYSFINVIEDLKYEEETYYNNAPENLQYSQRYVQSEEAIDFMDDAIGYLNDVEDCESEEEFKQCINDAINALQSAIM